MLTEFDLLTSSSLLIEQRTSEDDVFADVLDYLHRSGIGEALLSLYSPRTGFIEAKYASCDRLAEIVKLTRRDIQSDDILAQVLRTRHAEFIPDSGADPRCDKHAVALARVKSQYVLPLALGTELIGTLQVDTTPRASITPEEKLILQAVSATVSIAISHIRNTSRLLDLSNQVMTSSRFLVAETLAGVTVHSLKHRLELLLKDLDRDLEKKEFRQRRELLVRLQEWKDQLLPLFVDAQKALTIVKAQGANAQEQHTDVTAELQPTIDLWISLFQYHKSAHRDPL